MKSVEIDMSDVEAEGVKEKVEALKSLGMQQKEICEILNTCSLSGGKLSARLLKASVPRTSKQIILSALVGTATGAATVGAISIGSTALTVASPIAGLFYIGSMCASDNDPEAAEEAYLRGYEAGKRFREKLSRLAFWRRKK